MIFGVRSRIIHLRPGRILAGSPKKIRQSRVPAYQEFYRRENTTSANQNDDGFGVIYNPPPYEHDNKELSKSIRCCITGYNQKDHESYTKDTGMSICFLGTGAGIPTRYRSTTSTLLRLGGSSMLFDAGEGVQRQLAFTRAKPSHIERIFITHLHGDHIFGLPGFLLGLQQSIMSMRGDDNISKNKRKRSDDHVVKIYGPPGLYNYIASNIILSCTKFHSLSIEVYELVGGRVKRAHGDRTSGMRNPFDDVYPEYNYGIIKRKFINADNGVWNLQDIPEKTRQSIVDHEFHGHGQRQIRIKAAELDHLSGIVTFGFVVEEEEPARNVDVDKAKELGILHTGRKYDLLKHGFSVQTEDGSRTVQPEEVWTQVKQRARKITITGDNRGWTPQMKEMSQNSDVLIHEATLTGTKEDYSRGHSTAGMAGRISGDVNAPLLVLNHISSKSDRTDNLGQSNQLRLIEDARKGSKGKSEVVVAYDFMELLVPRMGFRKIDQEDEVPSNLQSSSDRDEGTAETRTVVKEWFEKTY